MPIERLRMELQIRQNSQDVPSEQAADITDVTIVEDEFHPNTVREITNWRAYVEDDHDVALDVDLQHTSTYDDDFSHVESRSTVSLTSGSDEGNVTIDGPVGRFRFIVRASAAGAAPTSGSMVVELVGT